MSTPTHAEPYTAGTSQRVSSGALASGAASTTCHTTVIDVSNRSAGCLQDFRSTSSPRAPVAQVLASRTSHVSLPAYMTRPTWTLRAAAAITVSAHAQIAALLPGFDDAPTLASHATE